MAHLIRFTIPFTPAVASFGPNGTAALLGKERGPDPPPIVLGLLAMAIIIIRASAARIPAWVRARP